MPRTSVDRVDRKWLAEAQNVANDPNVWSGRASQVDFVELAVNGLASMYPAFDWSIVLLAIMDISARAISLPDRPQPGHLGHQCSHAPGRPNLHLVSSSRRPQRVVTVYSICSQVIRRLAARSLRRLGHARERSRRYAPACWQVRSQGHCDAASSWPLRSNA